MPINDRFLYEPTWSNVTNEQGIALKSLLEQHTGMDKITRPSAPGQIVKATLSGGPAAKTSYLIHPDGTVEVESRIDWPEDDETNWGLIALTRDARTLGLDASTDPIYETDDFTITWTPSAEGPIIDVPPDPELEAVNGTEQDLLDSMSPTVPEAMAAVDAALVQQMADIVGHLNTILSPEASSEDAAEALLALLNQARPPIEDAELPPAQAAAMQQSRKFEALQRIRDAADYAEAKLIAREMEQPTTWRDENGEYHTLVGDHGIGPKLSGRAFLIAEFEATGQRVLESYGIDPKEIESIKAKRSSVLAELQGAIQRIVDNGGTPDEKTERLREAVKLCHETNASRKLQRLFADHRWPPIPLARYDDGRDVRVEMMMPKTQWDNQVWSRLEAIVEMSEIAPTVTPRAVREVMAGQRDLAWLFRLAVLARGDLGAVLGVFEKNPDKSLDVILDVSPLFMEYTEMRIKQIVQELASLGVIETSDKGYRLNREVWHVG